MSRKAVSMRKARALTYDFCYRNQVVASIECYPTEEATHGEEHQYVHEERACGGSWEALCRGL